MRNEEVQRAGSIKLVRNAFRGLSGNVYTGGCAAAAVGAWRSVIQSVAAKISDAPNQKLRLGTSSKSQ